MEAKEKAIEMVEKYLNTIIHFPYIDSEDDSCIGTGYMTHNSAVRCAINSIDDTIKEFMRINLLCSTDNYMKEHLNNKVLELQEVKQEIEKL